jgi:hypothetical protein
MDVAPADGGSHDPGVEARVTRLEDQFGRIELLLGGIEKRLDRLEDRFDRFDERTRALEVGVAEIKGRISMIPGVWQQMTMIVATQATLAGFLFGALKLSGH